MPKLRPKCTLDTSLARWLGPGMGIDGIDESTARILQIHGFDEKLFESLGKRLRTGQAGPETNRIQGEIAPPGRDDVKSLPPRGSDKRKQLDAIGRAAIAEGRVGAIVLAGGMATRFGGVVKAGVEALDGASFLDLKLRDSAKAAKHGRVPVYLMTSFATDDAIAKLAAPHSTDARPVETFAQLVSLRLTPEGELFRDDAGKVSPYAPGHGDMSFALRRSGCLKRFRDAGGTTLFMSNVDNLTATLDPAVIGAHLESGEPMTAEMAPKVPGDRGGAPARVDGVLQIVEGFRFPEDFDQDAIPVFNTNTLTFDAAALDRDFDLSWFAVNKEVDGRPVVQFEHLVGQLSAFLPTHFLRVEREGDDARFQPVKDPAELEARRPAIRRALQARGVLD